MVHNRKQLPKRRVSLYGAAALAVALILVGTLAATHKIHLFESTSTQQKQRDAKYNNDKKSTVVQNNGNPATTNKAGEPVADSGTYTPPDNASGITISASEQNGRVVISTKLAGYSDGTCALTITNGSQATNQDAQVIYAPEFSTCAGFTQPVSALGAGNWTIRLAVTSGGITTTKTITFTAQ